MNYEFCGNYCDMDNKERKILKFEPKPRELLTDSEIMKVFGGLVRLIQKSAEYNATKKVESQLDYYVRRLNEVTCELNKRVSQVDELLKLNDELIRQNLGK